MSKESKDNKIKDGDFIQLKCHMQFTASEDGESIKTTEINGIKYDVVEIVAAVGDIFYQNVFMPMATIKKASTKWNKSIHDFSHLATGYPTGDFKEVERVDFVVGFHKKAHFDKSIGGAKMMAYVSHQAPQYRAWRNYIDICRAAGTIPNTSLNGMARFGMMDVKELPSGVKVPKDAVDSQGNVVYVKELYPNAVTTCLRGKCDDKDGCGVDVSNSCNCDSVSCSNEENEDKECNSEDSEYRDYLIHRLNKTKGKGD